MSLRVSGYDDAAFAISWIRDRVASALLNIDKALQSTEKRDKRLYMLQAGAELEGAVREVEQLLKVEPPR